MVSAGAYLPPALQQAWEDLGVIVLQGYGATECGPVAATRVSDHPLATVGKAHRAGSSSSWLMEANEILIGGPTVFDGYWKDPDATAAVMTADGWYRTGDVGRFDKRGNLVLIGPDQEHHRPAQRPERLSGGHRERPLGRRPASRRS